MIRVSGIIKGNHRKYCRECAAFIEALGEVRESRGEINGKAKLMEEYCLAYCKEVIQFLCYRKNIFPPITELSAPYEGRKHEKFATLYVLDETGDSEPGTLKKESI